MLKDSNETKQKWEKKKHTRPVSESIVKKVIISLLTIIKTIPNGYEETFVQ